MTKGAASGWVAGLARPVHTGRSTQVRQTGMHNGAGALACGSRIPMALLAARG